MRLAADLNVLVTRPQGQADSLIAAIKATGARACHYPVMAINALDAEKDPQRWLQCKQQIMGLDHYQHVIFISTNAVKFGFDWINQYWPQLPVGIKWYGIGATTNQHLLREDLVVEAGAADGPMNSEALLQHENLQQLQQQKVLIVRGVGGREYLQQQLQQRGASVSYVECYQRSAVDKPVGDIAAIIADTGINTICINSGESLQNLSQLMTPEQLAEVQRDTWLIVAGERVAAIARDSGFQQVFVAKNASDSAMLEALSAMTD